MAVKLTQALVDKVFAKHYDSDVSQADAVDNAMDELNELLGGYGVEAIQDEHAWIGHYYMNIIALYVNMGDTYDTTVVYDTDIEEAHIGSWGDFYESWLAENVTEEELDGLGGISAAGIGEIYFTTGLKADRRPYIRLSTETTGKKGALYDIELLESGEIIRHVNMSPVNSFPPSKRKALKLEDTFNDILPALERLLVVPADSKEYRELWWEIKQAIGKVE